MAKKHLCKETMDKICDILEVELGHEAGRKACAEVMAHLEECPSCYAEVDTLRKTVKIFQAVPDCDVPDDVQSRLMVELKLEIPLTGDQKQEA